MQHQIQEKETSDSEGPLICSSLSSKGSMYISHIYNLLGVYMWDICCKVE